MSRKAGERGAVMLHLPDGRAWPQLRNFVRNCTIWVPLAGYG